MFQNLEIFQMSASMAEHAGRRQALAAENMANVDTPGYRAHRLSTFADLLPDQGPDAGDSFSARATRAGHLHGSLGTQVMAREEAVKSDPAPDGNTVSVEREMLESVSARREHDRALAVYKSALKILHSSLARS